MSEEKSLFKLAKDLDLSDLKEYMLSCGVDFKGNLGFCPFHSHDHKSPSMGVKNRKGEPFFNCFNCGSAGDIIKFAELYHKVSPLEAATKVLDFFHIPYIAPGVEISDEERTRIENEIKERRAKADERRAKAQAAETRLKNFIGARITDLAPKLAENYVTFWEQCKDEVLKNFPNQSANFQEWANVYMGYDMDHRSIVIINREETKVTNLKYRQKFLRDEASKMLTTKRMDGKWIGEKSLIGAPFPLTYFKEHKDNRVVICEGEKDALNLLSYDVNVLTLGGVSNSWTEHAHLLKGKTVYIWFDNDNAGYTNAIKRYYEIDKFAEDIFLVPFFAINAALPNKYDISDYLKDNDHVIKTAEDVFHHIAYSCFKVTNILIDEIEEFIGEKLPPEYRRISPLKDFRDIKREWIKKDNSDNYVNVIVTRGELDDEYVDHVLKTMNKLMDTDVYPQVKKVVAQVLFDEDKKIKEAEDVIKTIDKTLEIKRTLLTNYRQTHIVDMVNAFLRMTKKAGYTFGEYKGMLHVWTGTHYLPIDSNTLSKFIHNEWMYAAKVDVKKQTKKNIDEVIKDLMSKSRDLDEDKMYENRRVINVLNGTLFITSKGKITFVPEHRQKDAATNILAFEYDQKAKAPKWSKFLSRVLPDENDQKTLMEFIGYCFMPTHEYETFLYLYGQNGSNGKSVILDTIKSFFGDDNISALQLQQLEGHQLHALTGKILNIGSEIDKNGTEKGQIETLKQLVSPGDSVQINPKNKDPYLLLPNEKPKMAFAGNNKIKQGVDNAFFRRMLLLVFNAEIQDDEKIRGLSNRFKDELSGIFNMALDGLERLIRQGKFTRSTRMKEELEEYKDEANPLRTFIREAIIIDKDIMVPGKHIYALYCAYVGSHGGKPLKDTNFWGKVKDELASQGTKVEIKQVRIKTDLTGLGDRARCAMGIGVNKDFEIASISPDNGTTIIPVSTMNLSVKNAVPLEDIDA